MCINTLGLYVPLDCSIAVIICRLDNKDARPHGSLSAEEMLLRGGLSKDRGANFIMRGLKSFAGQTCQNQEQGGCRMVLSTFWKLLGGG